MLVHLITLNHFIDLKHSDQTGFIDNHAALDRSALKRPLHGKELRIRLAPDFVDVAVATLTDLFNLLVNLHRVLLNYLDSLINITRDLFNRTQTHLLNSIDIQGQVQAD